jgi:signal transduction histidine kinase
MSRSELTPLISQACQSHQNVISDLIKFQGKNEINLNGLEQRCYSLFHSQPGAEVYELKDWVSISIRDNGIGIIEDNKPNIFELHMSTKEKSMGTGLGLPIVKQIIEFHGGFILFESQHQEGTTFRLFLPIFGPSSISEA